MPSEHARFSPSSFERLIRCPASLKMQEGIQDSSTEYSRTGTSAHRLCEHKLLERLGREDALNVEELEGYDEAMERNAEEYASYVWECYQNALARNGSAVLHVEHRVCIPGVGKDGDCFGTGDAILFTDGMVHVFDYKNGVTPVESEENAQLMAYAYGAVNELGLVWGCEEVNLTIFQPNISNTSTWGTTWEHVDGWFNGVLVPATREAVGKNPHGEPGDHCKFCKAKARCGFIAEMAHEVAVREFCSPDRLIDMDEVGHFLGVAKTLKDWIGSLEAWALDKALKGEKVPGWKVVEGKSNRSWSDEGKAAEAVKALGFEPYRAPELKTLTDIERMVGKKQTKAWEKEGLLVKPQGKPTLALETDERAEFVPAVADFSDELKNQKENT